MFYCMFYFTCNRSFSALSPFSQAGDFSQECFQYTVQTEKSGTMLLTPSSISDRNFSSQADFYCYKSATTQKQAATECLQAESLPMAK